MNSYTPNDNVQDVHDINKMNNINILPSPQARTYSYKAPAYDFEKPSEDAVVDVVKQKEQKDLSKNKQVSKIIPINCDNESENSSLKNGKKLKLKTVKSPEEHLDRDRDRSLVASRDRDRSLVASRDRSLVASSSSPSDVWRQTKSRKNRKSRSPTPLPISATDYDIDIDENKKFQENEEKIKNLRYIVSISNTKKKQIQVKNGVNVSLKDMEGEWSEGSDGRDDENQVRVVSISSLINTPMN
jgi:hypothetical protein